MALYEGDGSRLPTPPKPPSPITPAAPVKPLAKPPAKPKPPARPAPAPGPFVSGNGNASVAIAKARSMVGGTYVLGGFNPAKKVFDCSSLTQWAYGQAGVRLPRTAAQQWNATAQRRVSRAQLQPGDLVFFRDTTGRGKGITHVGIYQGNGLMVNAVSEGKGIQVQSIDSPYWSAHFAGGGRVAGQGGAPAGVVTDGRGPRLNIGFNGNVAEMFAPTNTSPWLSAAGGMGQQSSGGDNPYLTWLTGGS